MTQAVRRNRKSGFRIFLNMDAIIHGAKLLFLAAAVFGICWGGFVLYRTYDVPIAVIGVEGELKRVRASELENIVAQNLGGGFLSLDLRGICMALEDHPWIVRATAKRKWPNEVVITVEEETPIARWGDKKFLSNQGKVLDAAEAQLPENLPLLDGPPGQERRVMNQYRNFSQILRPLGLKVEVCQLAPRENWMLTLENGIQLSVGKEPLAEKLNRFLKVWSDELQERADDIAQVDIRYANGVAVRWKEVGDAGAKSGNKI